MKGASLSLYLCLFTMMYKDLYSFLLSCSNVPGYFYTVWKVISPWLDDEIRSKTFFAPKKVDDVEKAIKYLNKMNLKVGLL